MSTKPRWVERLDGVWTLVPLVIVVYMLSWVVPAPNPRLTALAGELTFYGLPLAFAFLLAILTIHWASATTGVFAPRAMRGSLRVWMAPGAAGGALAALLLPATGVHSSAEGFQGLFIALLIGVLVVTAWRLAQTAEPAAGARRRGEWRDYWPMTKPGLNGLVLVTTLIGFKMGTPQSSDWPIYLCFRVLFGTALVAGGASVLNQVIERAQDARMKRTAQRPLPQGRVTPAGAFFFGTALACTGLFLLALTVNILTAFLGALSLASYLFLYTPLKRINSLSTLAGAISGALPPAMGWTGAGGVLSPVMLTLFFILFLWQIPHFLAIAWKYREDYANGGFMLFSVQDPRGRATGVQAVLYAAALVPVSLLTTFLGATQLLYLIAAFLLGLGFAGVALAFAWRPTPHRARILFFTSIAYLPLLLAIMVIDQASLS